MREPFGDALRRLRGDRSVRDVAALAACGKTYVSDLENGKRQPTEAIARALDTALGAHGELVDLALADSGADPIAQAAALHRGLADTIAAAPLTDTGLDEWEYTVARHGRATRYRPEGQLLPELIGDFSELRRLLAHRHPPTVRRRLTITAAQMAGLMALTLLKLGEASAQAWWRTGRQLAAAAEDRATMSWIYAQEAYQAYYGGDMHGALELAVRAQQLAGGLPCVGPALAAPLEARAHAVLGQREPAAAALADAETALDRLDPAERIGSAFGYSKSQLRFHAGNAWTHLGQTGRAREEHARARELYPDTEMMDRALIELDAAMCSVLDGDPAAGAHLATHTVTGLPHEHRSALIIYRAREVARRVPEARQVPEVRVLREVLALPPGRRDHGGDQAGDQR